MRVPTGSPTRRLAALAAALAMVAASLLLGTGSASGGSIKGSLRIVSVTDSATGLAGAVKDRPFTVVVEVLDTAGVPLVLTKALPVSLSASGPGSLSGTVSGSIPKNASRGTISGVLYSAFGNGIILTASDGGSYTSGQATIAVAATAVKTTGNPHVALNVTDPACAAPSPSSPVCGYLLLPNGANGTVLMSVGSCSGIVDCFADAPSIAGLVSASMSLKDANGLPLYSKTAPASFVIGCDKTQCGGVGVPHVPFLVDLNDTGNFITAPDCPSRGTLGPDQDVCQDQVQGRRDNAGDLYTTLLFDIDIRASHP